VVVWWCQFECGSTWAKLKTRCSVFNKPGGWKKCTARRARGSKISTFRAKKCALDLKQDLLLELGRLQAEFRLGSKAKE